MRRVLSLVLATLIVLGGLYVVVLQVFYSSRIVGWWFLSGGFAVAIGVAWLWEELSDPTKPSDEV